MALTPTNVLDNSMTPGIAAEIFKPDQLFAGPFQPVSEQITVLSGQGVIARGTVLGKVTASGKYIKCVSTAVDGSQTPSAIAADTIDATSADAPAVVIDERALVSHNGLTWGTSINDATKRAAAIAQLRAVHIKVREGA